MVLEYPDFVPLTLEHQAFVNDFTQQYDTYSDFNFISLYCWNTNDTTAIATLNGNLVISLPDYTTGKRVVSLLGTSRADESLTALLADFSVLNMVPETTINSLTQADAFRLIEDPDNYDYIYDISALAHLSGKELKKKRNKINSVETELGSMLTVTNTRRLDAEQINAIRHVFQTWSLHSKNAEDSLSDALAEKIALNNLLENLPHLNVLVTLIYLKADLIAFSFNELIGGERAICHFEKAVSAHSQINSYIAIQAVRGLLEEGCKFVNWEQDLGLAGLRKSKSSYQPVGYLKKYTVSKII